jgi:hypothetical protein
MKPLLRSKTIACLTVSLCLFMLLDQALGWGAAGHMIVAQIAYVRLNSRAKAEVDRLIKISIYPSEITNKSLDFVNAAHWPDDLRPDPNFKYSLPLHYINLPFSMDGTKLPPDLPLPDNIITALQKYVDILKSNADDYSRAQALRFIIHFVGDIHQPLHGSARVSEKFPKGDLGGNLVVIMDKGKKSNLHSYWDDGIGDFPKSYPPDYVPPPIEKITPIAERITAEFPDTDFRWRAGGPFDYAGWAEESLQLAEDVAYPRITEGSQPSEEYNQKALKVVHKRVAWGGYRLAELLNAIWPEQQ